ncbi:sn-glycerol-3-phosphate ABC transporter ATP-binding protein UgpC [Devosia sp. 63-57]|uniref:ABC transporter ATP-binding protein n=1 Tax=Devosia sp. 63-57 TaxID=1895751 RepID=UPI00086926BC|nr:sn-glycerol-3-phosphate ABC transporter ATP-binding protein UgpC [Devosia sp. 63-57]ODT47239.1 MAG: sugar ABC transporter ATP-binding protein [Pelagibacterium sp. SCN 63-126]ODU89057.1 MAG: sugar ABC transporter ATP-binding protein [Pelagibacterium sp. SCN 63-17]OJX43051.1 MAG: sugar ABC transporter ATP-binding protein [Devosia sp. 63-57]
MAQVRLDKVRKSYGKLETVHGIDLEIAHNEFVVLVGPSGCGKSTTLRMIAGLEEISGGTISIGDRVVNDLPPRARNISMVFQSYALYPHMTVRDNLGFGLKIANMPPAEIDKRVTEAAEILGLGPYMDRLPANLSGGQRQRVAMGRAIVRNPDVFLFDEPLSNLDAKLRGQMRVEIKKLHQRVKTTVIYVTHDQVEAMTLADRIVIMRDGHIEQVGTPSEVFEHPVNTFVAGFIGSPPMNQLDAVVKEGKAVLSDGVAVPLPSGLPVREGQQIVLGFRPESLAPKGHSLHTEDGALTISRPVTIAEPLGTETILFVEMGSKDVQGKMLNPRVVHPGEELTFTLDLTRLHVFDRASGKSVRA